MKCICCKKEIEKGYVLSADVFCSKKCVTNHERAMFKSVCWKFKTKKEVYQDEPVRDVQKALFGRL